MKENSFKIVCNNCGNSVTVKEGKTPEDVFIYEYEDEKLPIGVFKDDKKETFFGCHKCRNLIG
jgi:hypothetical protein